MVDIAVGNLDTPNVEGELQGDAQAALSSYGIAPVSVVFASSSTIAAGIVISQSIQEGTANFDPETDTMILTISTGASEGALADSPAGYRRLRRYLGDRS